MDRRSWVVTCDPGIDDAVALAVVAGRDDCELRAVVAGAGNVDATTAWHNACGLARLFGLGVPVAIGSTATVDGRPIHREGHPHGADGLAGLAHRLPAAGDPPRDPAGPGRTEAPADARPRASGRRASDPAADARATRPAGARGAPPCDGSLLRGDVVATGPLTDVALALGAGRSVERVVWMGGSYAPAAAGRGAAGEFNAGVDPRAVDEVVAAGIDLAVVPIEVTRRVSLGRRDLGRWSSGPPAARLCADLAASRARDGRHRVALHDPVAVVAALEPGLFGWQRQRVRCTRAGDAPPGVLLAVPGAPGATIAVDVDVAAVRDRIVDAVLAASGATDG